MNERYITVSREELYKEVWSDPISLLAAKYGISDVGLSKICKRHSIPLPGRGYWAKKVHGKPVPKRPPLPDIDGDKEFHSHIVIENNLSCLLDKHQYCEIEELEKADDNKINVVYGTDLTHPIAVRTAKSIKSTKTNEKGIITPKAKNCFSVSVAHDSIERSLCIIDALMNSLSKRGYKFEADPERNSDDLCVNIDGIFLHITLEETVKRIEHVITPEEEKKKKRDRWYHFKIPQHDYIPTGKLTLRINRSWQYGGRTSWSDGKIQRVENCLNYFIIALKKASLFIKKKKEEDEIRARKREIERQNREEFLSLQKEEEERLKTLLGESADWHRSQLIRTL